MLHCNIRMFIRFVTFVSGFFCYQTFVTLIMFKFYVKSLIIIPQTAEKLTITHRSTVTTFVIKYGST